MPTLFVMRVEQQLRTYVLERHTAEELRFAKTVTQGLLDVRAGNTVSLEETRKTLGIK